MSGSLIDLGGLAEPVKVLIDRVSDAVGGIARPWQIERVAKAEGRADVARAEAKIQVSEIEQRAIQRLVKEEGRRQENIESITAKATENVSEEARPEAIEEDWLTNFFAGARNISDKDMQEIWAGILAGEANRPGSYSRKTVDLLATLDKRDAESFKVLSRFTVNIQGRSLLLIFDISDTIYQSFGISFEFIGALEDLGLVKFNNVLSYSLTSTLDTVDVDYGNFRASYKLKEDRMFSVGKAMFYTAGSQLFSFLKPNVVDGFPDYFTEQWKKEGCLIVGS